MIMSEGPGVAILKFLTFAKKGILYYTCVLKFSHASANHKYRRNEIKPSEKGRRLLLAI